MVDILRAVQQQVREICVFLHTEFVALVAARQKDNDEDNFMNLSEVLQMDLTESLEHIAAAVKELMTAKRELHTQREADVDLDERQRYERALQKVESEVRNHIKIEQQLKLHIEHLQQKIDDFEQSKASLTASYEKAMQEIRKDNAQLSDLLKSKDRELTDLRSSSMRNTAETSMECRLSPSDSSYHPRTDKSKSTQDVKRNSQRDSKFLEMERKIAILENQLKTALLDYGDKQKECEKWKKEFETLHITMRNKEFIGFNPVDDSKADYFKRKYEEKCCEMLQMESNLSGLSRGKKPSTSLLEAKRSLRKLHVNKDSSTRESRSVSPLPTTLKRTKSTENREMYTQIVTKTSARVRKNADRSLSMEKLRREKPKPSSNVRYFSMIAK